MTKESALLVSVAAIIGAVGLGVGFSTGFFHPDPIPSLDGSGQDAAGIVATATPKDAPTLVKRAQDLLALGNYKEAIVFLRAATRLNPKDVAAWKMLASAAFQANDAVLAANSCYAITQQNAADADAQLGLAKALYTLNRLPDAAAACRAVLIAENRPGPLQTEAKQILLRIPAADQKKPPEATFPIISAFPESYPEESRSGSAARQ